MPKVITENDYIKLTEKIEALGFGRYIDPCVDRENSPKEDHPHFWSAMLDSLKNSVTIRAEEDGINLPDYGI